MESWANILGVVSRWSSSSWLALASAAAGLVSGLACVSSVLWSTSSRCCSARSMARPPGCLIGVFATRKSQ
ncbi:hypothetical protein BDP67DRAFT_515756 [Colletotrichum lupini]|nr:hypothetical protein BDP67DRAFT_515756 [Colletotrichum lupini]